MGPLWLAIAFVFGFGARRVGLPSLVGYLLAGFGLDALGAEAGGFIDEVADVGVLLMLFSIGLKLQLRTLARPVICAGATIHMVVIVVVLGAAVFGLAAAGLPAFAGLDRSPERVSALQQAGRNVILGDSTDLDLYERIEKRGQLRMVLLALRSHQETLTTVRLLKQGGFTGVLAALARHDDEVGELRESGVEAAFNLSDEAGVGFARHALEMLGTAEHPA